MNRDLALLKRALEQLKGQVVNSEPLVNYSAPNGDTKAVELFAKARAGDAEAQNAVRDLIRERKWVDWIGDLGRQATGQLIRRVSGGDSVWQTGITQKADALSQQLLGDKPSVLEELLVRRVVNGWIATHVLELELTLRAPDNLRSRAYLDAALTRAQKRFTSAIGELARVRRLQAPRILAQLNVAAAQTVVNGMSGG
jgi:hypothetical protein